MGWAESCVAEDLLATHADQSNRDYNVYFTGRMIWEEHDSWYPSGGPVALDRLGSVAAKGSGWALRYFPYGQEASSTWAEHNKFATYFQDSTTNLNYARNRYYSSTLARFTTPDPYRASGGPADPQSWNRYAYVHNDPVNFNDPSGWARCGVHVYGLYLDDRSYSDEGLCGGGGGSPGSQYMELLPEHNRPDEWQEAPWDSELVNLITWRATLAMNLEKGLPAPCDDALTKLNGLQTDARQGQPQISAQGLLIALNRVDFRNGVGTTDLYMSLFPGRTAPSASMAQYTIGQRFADRPGISAEAALGGNVIYFRPGAGINSSTIMHELLHNLGLEDREIMQTLGLTGASVEISRFLWDTCLKPPVTLLP